MAASEHDLGTGEGGHLTYYGHLSYYGKFEYPDAFDWKRAYERYGVAGFCTIRVRHDASSPLGDAVAQAIRDSLLEEDVEWTLGFTTGWDDHVVFLFAKNYITILHAIWKIRDLIDPGEASQRLLTSCTLPLVRFDWTTACEGNGNDAPVRAARNAMLNAMSQRISFETKIGWAVRFAVLPGELMALESRVRMMAEELGIHPKITKLFGQADFRCTDPEGTQGSLMRFLVHVAFPLVTEQGTVIRNIETHLHLETEETETDAGLRRTHNPFSSSGPRRDIATPPQIDSLAIQNLEIAGIPRYTIRALQDVFSRIDLLQNNDLLKGEFDSLVSLRNQFNISAQRLLPEKSDGPHEKVSDWLTGFERCLADRYRGIYPTGESITMRMATYHASHQKFLRVADHIIERVTSLALSGIESQWKRSMLRQVAPVEITAVSYLGNSPTGQCTDNLSLFGTGYIELPVSEVFNFGRSEVLLHETGHHVTKAVLQGNSRFPLQQVIAVCLKTCTNSDLEAVLAVMSDEDRKAISSLKTAQVNRHFFEIMAEILSCTIGFDGDAAAQWNAREAAFIEVFTPCRESPDPRAMLIYKRARFTYQLRNLLVGALLGELRASDAPPAARSVLMAVRKLRTPAEEINSLGIYRHASLAARAICELAKFPEFSAVLRGISPVELSSHFNNPDYASLKKYRQLLCGAAKLDLVDSLDALRDMWSYVTASAHWNNHANADLP